MVSVHTNYNMGTKYVFLIFCASQNTWILGSSTF